MCGGGDGERTKVCKRIAKWGIFRGGEHSGEADGAGENPAFFIFINCDFKENVNEKKFLYVFSLHTKAKK